jgi:hypothetical protein
MLKTRSATRERPRPGAGANEEHPLWPSLPVHAARTSPPSRTRTSPLPAYYEALGQENPRETALLRTVGLSDEQAPEVLPAGGGDRQSRISAGANGSNRHQCLRPELPLIRAPRIVLTKTGLAGMIPSRVTFSQFQTNSAGLWHYDFCLKPLSPMLAFQVWPRSR